MRIVVVLYILTSFVKLIDGTFKCVNDGLFENPDDRNTFWHCAHGTGYLKYCPPSLIWSQLGQHCVQNVVEPTIAVTTSLSATITTETVLSTTKAISTTTSTSNFLPPQCWNYTSITDGTRHANNRNPGVESDASYFSTTPTWVRFEGAAGTRLADHSVATNRCGAEATGWIKFTTEPTVGKTANQTVCFNWSGMSCIWPLKIPMTNCYDFFVYALVAPALSDVRYCTI